MVPRCRAAVDRFGQVGRMDAPFVGIASPMRTEPADSEFGDTSNSGRPGS